MFELFQVLMVVSPVIAATIGISDPNGIRGLSFFLGMTGWIWIAPAGALAAYELGASENVIFLTAVLAWNLASWLPLVFPHRGRA